MQRYNQLCTQQDNLRQRLSLTTYYTSSVPPSSPDSLSLSPPRSFGSPTNLGASSSPNYLSVSQPVGAVPCPSMPAHDDHPDEERLADVNHQIKATLTELLNHESVRGDDEFRHWVQERLMEAEFEVRRHKRRNRRLSSVDREAVNAIAEGFRGPELLRFGTTL